MKIGFDISQTGKLKAGCGYFADSIIQNLATIDTANEYVLYRTFGDYYWDDDFNKTTKIKQQNFNYGLHHSSNSEAKDFWQHQIKYIENKLSSPDILHANNYFCPKNLQHAKLVYTLYDLSYLIYPEWTTEANRLACFNGVFNASLYADFMIAISENTKNDFLHFFPHYPADKIKVVYLGSRFSKSEGVKKSKSLKRLQTDKFWLTVGTIEPRKNQKKLLAAYAKLKAKQQNSLPLVLAGGKGWMMDDFLQYIHKLGLEDDVITLGYVDENELHWLYHNCFAMVYPSVFEGFGLPVLEAMSLGAAVITSNVSSLPEIVDTAGILVDPHQDEALMQAMLRLSDDDDYRKTLQERALTRAQLFSWDHAAQEVLQVYQQLVGS
jgi:glycosyltransferase involved in cell wall biosynthesis